MGEAGEKYWIRLGGAVSLATVERTYCPSTGEVM